ncbi:glycosyltransferase family 2 protein [Candidatus Omnitrophota bacterium]
MSQFKNAGIDTSDSAQSLEISVVMPCLNEEKTIGLCIRQALTSFKDNNLKGEVVICDNGSSDNSVEIAKGLGARLVFQKVKGYGCAYQLGILEARGKYIIIGDSDGTYDFSALMKFIQPLREGSDFVNGSRIKGRIHEGAMSFLHRRLGNPFLSFVLNLFFKSGFSDVYCGMKAFSKEFYWKIKPVSPGMEFALELVIKASRLRAKRTEIPIDLFPRKGKSKLRTFRDGWRSLRFMLLYCPNYLFIIPGALVFSAGLIGMGALFNGPVEFLGHTFDFHAMIFSSMLVLLGFQLINLGFFAKSYALAEGYEEKNTFFSNFYRHFKLEKGIFLGALMVLSGLCLSFYILRDWAIFGPMAQERRELFAFTIIIVGIQTVFSSFLISLIGMKNREL